MLNALSDDLRDALGLPGGPEFVVRVVRFVAESGYMPPPPPPRGEGEDDDDNGVGGADNSSSHPPQPSAGAVDPLTDEAVALVDVCAVSSHRAAQAALQLRASVTQGVSVVLPRFLRAVAAELAQDEDDGSEDDDGDGRRRPARPSLQPDGSGLVGVAGAVEEEAEGLTWSRVGELEWIEWTGETHAASAAADHGAEFALVTSLAAVVVASALLRRCREVASR
jgi:hypothetical protein